jgi:hypothetical protein
MSESTRDDSVAGTVGPVTGVKQEWRRPELRLLGDLRTITEAGIVPGGDGAGSSHIIS